MNLKTFGRLLETYGTIEGHWPPEVRAEAKQLLSTDAGARALLERYAPLDEALDNYRVNPDVTSVRAALLARFDKKNIIDRITAWLLPEPGERHAFWRPALAATLPLIIGIILGSTLSLGNTSSSATNWSDEISMVALSNTDTESIQ